MRTLGLLALLMLATGCTPLAVGAVGVVVVDEILEEENGDDGLI